MRSRALVLTVCGGLLVGLLSSAGLVSESAVAAEPGSAVGSVPSQPHARVPAQEVEGSQEPPAAPVWPTAASASVDLSSVPAGEAVAVTPSGEVVDAGGSAADGAALVLAPVAETAAEGEASPSGSAPSPGRVDVSVLDRASVASAGVGVGVRLTRADGSADAGPVRISLDYSGFRYAYGGSFASRLRLVRVPGCALTTPEADGCGVREFVEADNDTGAGVLTAVVQADPDPAAVPAGDGGASTQLAAPSAAAADGSGGTVYALASGSSSDAGDYRASPLGQTGSWDVSPGSGAFSYSVPVQVPEPPVGAAPSLALGYNAQSVDGRTSASNNQASWSGMGWDLNVGFIERRYRNCTQDGLPTIGDLCWDSPNTGMEPDGQVLVINLGGMTSQLVQDDDGAGSYHVLDDPGWRVQHLTGGHGGDDEYWVLSHQDGMRYYFGWGRSERTNATTGSVWTVPVVGNNIGEPCHGQFPEPCTQAWRWSLDRVVDADEVETAYFYNREFNHYRSVANTDQARQYISGGYLARIEYGWASQIAGAQLPAKVELSHVKRCAERMGEANPLDSEPAPCPSIDSSPSSYPDVPLDLRCDGTAGDYYCAGKTYYPTFFVEDMLWDIKTYVRDTDAAAWDLVMQYQMKYSLTNPPGVVDGTLWLDYVQRKGYGNDPDITLPVINFNGEYRDNQVGTAELNFRRIISIYGDLGSKTSITYGAPDACDINALPSQSSNTKNCFWQKWTPEGETEAKTGWFKKFLVTQVTVDPRVGVGAGNDGAPTMTTTYTYIGSPAWRFTNDPLTPDADESWTDWRGYKEAVVTTGTGANTASTHHWLFRGLDGDRTSKTDPSATRSVSVTDTDGTTWTDHAWLAGKTLETSARDEAGSSHERVFHKYWWHNTAQYDGLPDARFVREDETVTRTRISTSTSDDATWREHVVQNEYDSADPVSTTYGLPLRIDDWGQSAVGDNRCTTFGRAYNTDYYTVGGVQRWTVLDDEARHYTVGCADRAAANQDAYAATFYDGATSIAANAPVDGNPTEQREYTSDSAHRSVKASYDAAGRTTGSWDGKGNKTTTAYSPATSWPLNGVTVTGPDPDGAGPGTAMAVTTWSSRFWAAPWKIVDANGNTTRVDQDAVGRTAKVWKPTEVAAHPTGDASLTFTYTIPTATTSGVPDSVSGPPQATSNTLQSGSTYLTSHAYADGLGRAREAQVTAPSGTGRTVTATRYDTSGNVTGTSAGFFNSSTAGSGMVLPAVADLPSYTDLLIDWAGRTTESKIMVNGVNQTAGRVQTAYHHDYTTVTPAVGGATDTHTDVYGQTSKIVEHHGSATYTTTYAYTGSGHLQTITDDLGNTTGYTYNWAGDRLTSDDPDAGTSSTTYDANGNVATSTDAGGTTLTTTYDNVDRALTVKAGTTTLTTRTWDTAPGGKGQPATATAHIDGHDYTTATTGYDTRGRPTGTTVTIPAAETGLAGSYTTSYHYDAADHLTATDHPAAGGLPAETVTATHTPQGHPATLTSGLATYVDATAFDTLGRLTSRTYGTTATGQTATRSYTYNDTNGTGWLNNITATATTAGTPQTVQDDTYTRNNRGDITALRENQADQQQCYTYDDLRRLTAAWTTAATTCPATPGTDFTGPDPYQTTYAYDRIGNLQAVTDTTTAGSTTRDYHYPGYSTDESAYTPGADHPHAVTSITSATTTDTHTHNPQGQTTTRTVDGLDSTLTWNPQARLTQVTTHTSGGDEATRYLHDANGTLLLHKTPDETVLHLPGQELRRTGTATPIATRYYTSGGTTVAMRVAGTSNSTLTWLLANTQASTQLTIDAATGTTTRRRYTPYGDERPGTSPLPAGTDRGFLGKPEDDTTGLSLLGARPYDPNLGRFLATDPLTTPYDPQHISAYTYARNNPIAYTDPTGLRSTECGTLYDCGFRSNVVTRHTKKYTSFATQQRYYRQHATVGYRDREARDQIRTNLKWGRTKFFWEGNDKKGNHDRLDTLGATPIGPVADGLNAALYASEGNWGEAAWGATAAIPLLGDGIAWLRKLNKLRKSCDSFTPGTDIALADGTTKNIEDIKVGDKVHATDPKTGKTVARPVLATITTEDDKHFVDLTITTDDGPASIIATTHHPFWSNDHQAWINAGDLKPGTTLRTPNGTKAHITATHHYDKRQRTHNLTIEGIHTYYVLAGVTPVLVHNSNGCGVARNEKGQFTSGENADAARGRQTHLNYRNALGAGYDFEVTLPSGLRPDAVDWKNRVVRELKSDAKSSQATGRRQLQTYVTELEDMTGQSWTGHLDTYKRFG